MEKAKLILIGCIVGFVLCLALFGYDSGTDGKSDDNYTAIKSELADTKSRIAELENKLERTNRLVDTTRGNVETSRKLNSGIADLNSKSINSIQRIDEQSNDNGKLIEELERLLRETN